MPTENPKCPIADHTKPIALTVEKIANPSREKRQPIKPGAIPIDKKWTDKGKNPADRNTAKKITEKQQFVLYPTTIRSRYARQLRDHDLTECIDTECSLH